MQVRKRESGRWRTIAFSAALGLVGLLPCGLARTQSGQSQRPSDPVQLLERWSSDYQRLGPDLNLSADESLAPALLTLKTRLLAQDGAENSALLALCDLAWIAERKSLAAVAEGQYLPDAREATVRNLARDVLRTALDAPAGEARARWLATQVLARGAQEPIARRIAAVEALIGRHWDSTMNALLSAAAAPERGLREVAVAALAGWPSEAVDRFLAGLTLRALREQGFLSTNGLLDHFAARGFPVGSPVGLEVAQELTRAAVSADWRVAVRRVPMSRILPNELAVPYLVEALALWSERGLGGSSSRRVEALISRELELRSGLRLGMDPKRWANWWARIRATDPEAPNRQSAPPPSEGRTTAEFFGLRPWTDRVVFVIDRSSSMEGRFGTSSSSNYSEALRQVGTLLRQLGTRTRFNLILFSDETRSWSTTLRPATDAGIEAAVAWARNQPPRGGTFLRPAISQALEFDSNRGLIDLEKLEADTVIVLCDGATAEGPTWVAPLLRVVGEPTCVRFDCVQIGVGGDGTLEALAEESGGQFVRVDY